MAIRILAAVLTLISVAPVLAADKPEAQDRFTLPEGYSNERIATDPAKPQPAATAGELRSYATLHSLGFEWDLAGSDTNHNATCRVAYRRSDETAWHEAMPLFRVDYAGWYADRPARSTYNMLAGSIMFLRPATKYIVKLSLTDPDGGNVDREVELATHPVPDYGQPERTLHVVPRKADASAGNGSREEPFQGIEEAEKAARPGDLCLLHAGDYGAVTFKRSGEPAAEGTVGAQPKYIVWKAADDGPAQFNRMYLEASAIWLEGLTFHVAEEKTALRGADGTADVVVRANTFRGFSYSIRLSNKSSRWYVADNDIIGDATTGIGGEGVELNHSPHHTVCYNRISKTADGVSYCDHNCDIFANDILDVSDDGIEPDYGYANNRLWGNRLDVPVGITFQPMYCGPWYIVRNQVVASNNIFKLRVQDRYLVANNTFVAYGPLAGSKVSHAHGLLTATMRNNLWIHAGGSPFLWVSQVPQDKNRDYVRRNVLFSTLRADWRTDIDYDGFDWSSANAGKQQKPIPFVWNGFRIEDLSMLTEKVGIERHGRMIDKEKTIANYTPPPYDLVTRPVMLPRSDGDAIDAGVPLANIVEEFSGKAPDLGAFEAGGPTPHFGPRGDGDWRNWHNDWVLQHQREK